MTDPNLPPPERVVHQTTINTGAERKGGGGLRACILGGLGVAVAVIGWFLYSGGKPPAAPEAPEVNLDINVPAPKLPEAPRLPDVPRPAEPPTVIAPSSPEPQG